jgi:CRP-like cAMP-binding protein
MPESPRLVAPLQRVLYLKRLPAFSTLPGFELAAIAEHFQERFFSAGSVLLKEGRPVSAVYFVIEGALDVHRNGRFVGRVGPGAGVGGLGLFARDPEGALVTAASDTLALELDADTLLEVFEDRFPILHHVLRDTSRQIIDLLVRLRLDTAARMPRSTMGGDPDHELDLVERIFFLRQMQVFERASINALAELSRAMNQVRFEPGVTLWREGELAPGLFLVLRGTVRASSESRGLLFRPGPGFPLGAHESVAEVPRWYDAVTETRLSALQGNAEALIDVFEDNFEMAMDYLAVLSQVLLEIIESRPAQEARTGMSL